ncbi:MAG: hypothetical protein REI09_03430 [Candidatus Dactylopiibacterium sp.]|nr:hypothetical protein [Candidatus Dactylopiibacterium sp.]
MKTRILMAALAASVPGWALAQPVAIDFKAGAEPFTPAFMSLPGDAAKPLLVPTAGKPAIEDGKLALANGRFTIGAVAEGGKVEESTGSARPAGTLDLSKPYRITVKIAEAKATIAGKDGFFIYVNNSTSKRDQSPLGGASQLVKVSAGELKTGENIFEGSAGDATSFLQVRAESGAAVKIESIHIAPR